MLKEFIAKSEFNDESSYVEKDINSVSDGDTCKITGKLQINKKKTKTGANYYQLILNDKSSKTISQIIFNNSNLYPFIEENESFNGKATVYTNITKNGQYLNMNILNIILNLPDPVSEETVKESSDNTLNLINEYINQIINPGLKAVCEKIYSNKTFLERFLKAPATECSAYNFVGGLSQMTVQTAMFANEIADIINVDSTFDNSLVVNTDLLLVGALLCNIGRAYTLTFDETYTKISKTDYGILENDLSIARGQVLEAIKEVKAMKDNDGNPLYEIKKDTTLELLHMIDSSKGQIQFGALTVPRTKNAMFLSNITSLVFTKGLFENLERSNENNDRFVKAFDSGRSYFLPDNDI